MLSGDVGEYGWLEYSLRPEKGNTDAVELETPFRALPAESANHHGSV